MKNNKKVLKYCPNFHKIVNFEYTEEDYISERLISVYKDYIFSVDINNRDSTSKIEVLDTTISKYIDDYFFRKEMKNNLKQLKIRKGDNIVQAIVDQVLKIYNRYEEDFTRNIYISRWI